MTAPLYARLPRRDEASSDAIFTAFLDYVESKGLSLYPAQEDALLEILAGKNVILSTPTGSGKSLVAEAMHFKAMAEGKRSFYTCPIKALVSEKFFALCAAFGADQVGMMTGDATVNRDAPIVCCTAEILANMALRQGREADVDAVIMDEFHYYGDRDRGVAWQVPLLTLPQATFLLMSATLGPTERFEQALTALNRRETVLVTSSDRPVPLEIEYRETPLNETVAELVSSGRAPIYLVNFTQRAAAETAQDLLSVDFCTKDEKRAIAEAIAQVRFDSPYGKEVQKLIKHGLGIHHAGLLPRYRLTVEKLAQKGLLKIICGTDTLGVGVNVPIRTVLFTRLCKYDGEKTTILSVRDFQQISGRAGRKGFDDRGYVVVQAPEHVIENIAIDRKAASDPAKKRKLVRKKPPERGYVHWDASTFARLTTSPPEPLVSRFRVTHAMLLNVLSRPEDGCAAMKRLLRNNHEQSAQKHALAKTAIQLFRSLVEAGVVELEPHGVKVNAELQVDFSLDQSLALYLVDTAERLDRELPSYPLDVLSLVEAILEQPDLLLMKQVDKLKSIAMAEMKAAGVEFDERIAKLDEIDYPKPNAEAIYATFNAFAKAQPWVQGLGIHPKAIAREMFESFMAFGDYIKSYDLHRSEGLLLRYLTEVYKVLVQTVPELLKTEPVDEMIVYFGELVRGVDSSLLAEWERLRAIALSADGDTAERSPDAAAGQAREKARDVTDDARSFTVLIRNEVFRLVRALANRDDELAAKIGGGEWDAKKVEEAMRPFWAEYVGVRLDPAARATSNTRIERDEHVCRIRQTLLATRREARVLDAMGREVEAGDDAEGDANEWGLDCVVDLVASRAEGRAVLEWLRIGV